MNRGISVKRYSVLEKVTKEKDKQLKTDRLLGLKKRERIEQLPNSSRGMQ